MTTILGGGISGLAAAYYLRNKVPLLTILEASNRVGGWINSVKDENVIFELGPRTLRPKGVTGQNTLEMIEDLGLSNSVKPVNQSHISAKNRMIYTNKDNLCLLPGTLLGAMKVNPPFTQSFIGLILNDLKASHKKIDDESIYDFAKRRFGPEFANWVISPLICGICAGDAKEISVKFLMKTLFEYEQKYGGVIKGVILSVLTNKVKENCPIFTHNKLITMAKKDKWSVYTLNNGLEALPKRLSKYLRENSVDIQTKSECSIMTFKKDKVEITTNGKQFLSNGVISSIPAHKLAIAVKHQHPRLSLELEQIPYVDVAVVNLEYTDPTLIKKPGFGVLVPPGEELPILGIIFDSCCFNITDRTVLTVMMGGKWFCKLFGDSPNEQHLLEIAKSNIAKILGIVANPHNTKVSILKKCIPQYILGHNKRVELIRSYIKDSKISLTICGASYDGVGINDAIYSARQAANVFLLRTR